MNKTYIGMAGALLSAMMLTQTSLGAQDDNQAQGESDDTVIDEIVVTDFRVVRMSTSAKTDTPLIETPQSISVINADRIEAIGAVRLKEALSYTPGVNTSPWGDESNYDWVYLRGFDAYSPGFYLDGMQLRNGGTWAVWQTENYGTERIEFLRGPSSALYGQNGPGGLINVVTKQPTERSLREVQTQVGSYDHRQIAGDLSGPIDQDGDWLYRLTGLWQDSELSTGELPNDRIYIAPALTWSVSENTTLKLLSHYLRIRSGSAWNSYPTVGTLLPNPNGRIAVSTFTGEPDFDRYNQDQWMAGYLLEHFLSDNWTFRQSARYGRFDADYKTFFGDQYVTVNSNDPSDPANFRQINRTPFGSVEDANMATVDNQLQTNFEIGQSQHTVLVGLDYQRTQLDVVARYGGVAPPIDVYEPVHGAEIIQASPFLDATTTLSQVGFYVQDQFKLDEHWAFTLSGRYDHAKIDSDDHLASSTSDQTDNEFTGRVGVVYLADSGWAPYLSYSESFSPNTTINPDTGNPFAPETGHQYEAGLRYQPPGSKDTYTAAAFEVTRANYVIFDSVNFLPEQSGETVTRGLELEAVVQPIEGLNFTTAYSWTPTAEVVDSINPDEIGKQATPVPEHQLSLWGDYRFRGGLNLGLGLRYVGSTLGFNEAAPAEIPSYTLLDALVAYDLGPWRLAINVRNVLDDDYVASCNGSGTTCYYGGPRRVIGTFSYRW